MGQFEDALNKYAKYVIQQSRTNLTKGKHNVNKALYNSLKYNISKSSVTFDMLEYGAFQDEGVKGAKSTYSESIKSPFSYKKHSKPYSKGAKVVPPSSVFDKWSIKKGIAPRDKNGKFLERKTLNLLIARSIYRKGIRATMFFTKPFEAGLEKFGDSIVEGYIEDKLNIKE